MCETFWRAFKVGKPQNTPAFGYVCFVLRCGAVGGDLDRYLGLHQYFYDSISYIGWDSPSAPPSAGPSAAREFNALQTRSRQCQAHVYHLRHVEVGDMQALLAMEGKKFLCWQPRLEDGGHFFAVAALKNR
eukprot:6095166-Pyramimonas_sp.AAC.1